MTLPGPVSPHRSSPRGARLLHPYLLVGTLLLAGADGKGCKCRADDLPDPEDDVVVQDVQDVATALQIVSIDPSDVPAGEPFEAKIYGSAFATGASVFVGDSPAINVVVADENTIGLTVPGMTAGSYDVQVVNQDRTKATLRRGLRVREGAVVEDCSHVVVYFSYDDAGLSDDSRALLAGKIPCLQQRSGRVVVEGHTDERGSISYNLGLGERRAHSVQRHLLSQGVAPSRVEPVSYGEERPAMSGSTESAWSQNRRVEIHAK